jgi:hypothetical protein
MIHNPTLSPYLLAAQDLPRVWGRFDHQRPADGTNQMLVVVGMAAMVALVMLIWLRASRREKRPFSTNSSARLFRELCRAHGLSYANRRLLKRLAAARGLAGPAFVFVEPKHFDTANLPDGLQNSADDVRRLRAQLFG